MNPFIPCSDGVYRFAYYSILSFELLVSETTRISRICMQPQVKCKWGLPYYFRYFAVVDMYDGKNLAINSISSINSD